MNGESARPEGCPGAQLHVKSVGRLQGGRRDRPATAQVCSLACGLLAVGAMDEVSKKGLLKNGGQKGER